MKKQLWIAALAVSLGIAVSCGAESATNRVIVAIRRDSVNGIATWQYKMEVYTRGPDLIANQAYPFDGLTVGSLVPEGETRVIWAYQNTKQNNYAIPVGVWKGKPPLAIERYVVSDWMAKVCGLALVRISPASPQNTVLIAVMDAEGKAFIRGADCSGEKVNWRLYHGDFNGQKGVEIQDIAAGDFFNDGAMSLLVAFQENGHQKLNLYRLSESAGGISSKYVGTLLEWSAGYISAIAVGDADNDGQNELLMGFNDGTSNYLNIYKASSGQEKFEDFRLTGNILLPPDLKVTGIGVGALSLP